MLIKANYPDYKVNVIGISGKKEIGKKVFAEILQNELEAICEKPIVKVGYADHIYQTLISLFSPKLKWEHAQNKNEPIPGLTINGEAATMRTLLQDFGNYTRSIDPYVWIDRVFKHRINDYLYIIYDVRFLDEAKAVIDNNGLIIRLESEYLQEDNHVTETALDNFDFPVIVSITERDNIKDDIREIIRCIKL